MSWSVTSNKSDLNYIFVIYYVCIPLNVYNSNFIIIDYFQTESVVLLILLFFYSWMNN